MEDTKSMATIVALAKALHAVKPPERTAYEGVVGEHPLHVQWLRDVKALADVVEEKWSVPAGALFLSVCRSGR